MPSWCFHGHYPTQYLQKNYSSYPQKISINFITSQSTRNILEFHSMACSLLKFLLHLSFNKCGKGLVLEFFYTYFGLYSIISGIEPFPSNLTSFTSFCTCFPIEIGVKINDSCETLLLIYIKVSLRHFLLHSFFRKCEISVNSCSSNKCNTLLLFDKS